MKWAMVDENGIKNAASIISHLAQLCRLYYLY